MGGFMFRKKRNARAAAADATFRNEGWSAADSTVDLEALGKRCTKAFNALTADVGGLEQGRLDGIQFRPLETDASPMCESPQNSNLGFKFPAELPFIFDDGFDKRHAAFWSEPQGW